VRGWFRRYGDARHVRRGNRYIGRTYGDGRWEVEDRTTGVTTTGKNGRCEPSHFEQAPAGKVGDCYICSMQAKHSAEREMRRIGKGSRT